ncbi:MAG: CRISPR-associated helicase Cas3' [Selenomonas ruminantium]|jgi:CRISPR-associated endonuclease/helicase Cas3|uniref:CRISPR-associated helicase Cas3 n=1 Tax=Selenomonas ruminantium TaxID=971 RepID=A0A927ZPB7_SELRU|nr:CRISPR-associated helicase Cas3' [Selenomonas ruminantium]MBE6085437.1 CRISPR-associated helicase Cas3' [Selenomonas ruminantium]
MGYLAHRDAENGREQLLIEHLHGVSDKAGAFAAEFGEEASGRLVGLYHDIGKYSQEFQAYLRQGGGRKFDHSTAGALELMKRKSPLSIPAAFCVAGHHSGLLNGGNAKADTEESRSLCGRLKKKPGQDIPNYQAYREEVGDVLDEGKSQLIPRFCRDFFAGQFYTRMLFSCLVDADFLDTEEFMQLGENARGNFVSISELKERLDDYVTKKFLDEQDERYAEPINQHRRKILRECIAAGEADEGSSLLSLTVPTGGGKTIASLAFALHHAVHTGKKRVIYVIPYTSIIEQNAKVFQEILGDENVIEHHCQVDYSLASDDGDYDKPLKKQLATENWDAPLIVTTNVQFFESLFANRTSRCRKLHNIAASVIIFDEAQMLPLDYLRPCLAAIHELTRHYGATAVLCTATQPSLNKIFQNDYRREIKEICRNVTEEYKFFKRTKIELLPQKVALEEMADRLQEKEQVLCIVNTKKAARELFAALQGADGCFHLSTNLCPQHRKAILAQIRQALLDGKPCRVVSTSLIEAGVDVDFPCVYREMAGLDSIIQAAGRCNREGRRAKEESLVYVFAWADKAMANSQQSMKICRGATEYVCERHGKDLGSPMAIKSYFDFLHKLDGHELDSKKIMEMISKEFMPFAHVAEDFVLIETSTRPVFIPYDDAGRKIESQLRQGIRSRSLMREAGRFMVNVYCGKDTSPFEKMAAACKIEVLDDNVAILVDRGAYSSTLGLKQEIEDGQAVMF